MAVKLTRCSVNSHLNLFAVLTSRTVGAYSECILGILAGHSGAHSLFPITAAVFTKT